MLNEEHRLVQDDLDQTQKMLRLETGENALAKTFPLVALSCTPRLAMRPVIKNACRVSHIKSDERTGSDQRRQVLHSRVLGGTGAPLLGRPRDLLGDIVVENEQNQQRLHGSPVDQQDRREAELLCLLI